MSVFDASLSRRSFARTASAATAGIMIGVPPSIAARAQEATPIGEQGPGGPGLPPPPEGATVVAEGLINPRFLALGDDGTLYITENGFGGDETISPPAVGTGELEATPDGTPEAAPQATPIAEEQEEPPPTRGYTGRISQVTPDGTQEVLADGLASYSVGAGPNGIALIEGDLFFAIGGLAVGMGIDPLPEENTVNRLNLETGAVEMVAEIGSYEQENNPDGTDVNPNLYGMAANADGQLIVADAGGNTVYTIDAATGEFALAATVPELPELPGMEDVADAPERQAVPTGVAVTDDGTVHIGLLSEFWPEGAPSVLALGDDGTFGAAGGPLSFNVAIAVGPDGLVYASQLFSVTQDSPEPGPGSVVRITADGEIETVIENVMMPHGIAFDPLGNMFVAINSLVSGPGMAGGQVIRIDGVAVVG